MNIEETIRRASTAHQAGNFGEAQTLYRQILAEQPNHADALHLLGVLAGQTGRRDLALELINKALSVNPRQAEYHANIGQLLASMHQWDGAIAAYHTAIALQPGLAKVYVNLSQALSSIGETDDAITALNRALELEPANAVATCNLGVIFGQLARFDEAVDRFRQTLKLAPRWRQAQNNLGNALSAAGRFEEAEEVFRLALADHPADAMVHWNYGQALLRRGDFAQGWPQWQWRLKAPELGLRPPAFQQPRWDGGPLNGKRIFIHAEQGLGDAIQFARHIPEVARRGGEVVVGCHPELLPLFRCIPEIQHLTTTGGELPRFDTYCSFPSLPAILGIAFDSLPASPIPYLFADATMTEQWQARFGQEKRKRVGFCWAGRRTHGNDRYRSLSLDRLAPVCKAANIRCVSLQKGEAGRETRFMSLEMSDWTADLHTLADTAALLATLDLVITVDTAVAHLAGAMGKPVWVLLPFVPDWRWMLGRSDSPWYPSMRLFRQERFGDWEAPLAQAARELASFAA